MDKKAETSPKSPLAEEELALQDIAQPWLARILLVGLFVIAFPMILWQTSITSREAAFQHMRETSTSRLKLYSSNLVAELEKYEYLPIILSRDAILIDLLKHSDDPQKVDAVNRHLQKINGIAQISATYVMGADGTTLAASNWESDTSFVGRNFRFRPYFKNAMAGRSGHYFALGTTSKIPGYYLSYPMEDGEKTLGVIVVKVSVARLENNWESAGDRIMVSDANGIIIISSHEDWKFRSFKKLSEADRADLMLSRQYADADLRSIDVHSRETIDANTELISITDPTEIKRQGSLRSSAVKSYYVHSMPMLGTDWELHYLSDVQIINSRVSETLLEVSFACLVVFLVLLYLLQRRNIMIQRMIYQNRAREALEQAHAMLEQRVERRTAALVETNSRLENEIHERKKAGIELRAAQDELIQASKLAALGQMAAGITHEMNQPLTAIRTYSDNAQTLIERDRPLDALINLKQISELTARLAGISGQLKVFSRKAPSQSEPVNIAHALRDALTLMRNSVSLEHIEIINPIENDVSQSALYVMAETIKLQQVLINLIRNAYDAVSQNQQPHPQIIIDVTPTAERIEISVKDNGPGLPEADSTRVFDPFFTTKEVGAGLGLGLSISYRIVQDFGGTLKAGNRPEGGAVFTMDLRRAAKE